LNYRHGIIGADGMEAQITGLGKTELQNQFIEMRARGLSYSKIAKTLGLSKGTLSVWNKELSEEIASLKEIQLEELYEKYYLLKKGRIELIGSQLKKLQEELSSRDFSEVATEKLLDLLLRYHEALKAEYVELRDETDTKMNAEDITQELQEVLRRYREGEADKDRAQRETIILMSMIKAIETTELQKRLESLESVLDSR